MLFFRLDLVSLVHLQAGVDTDWPQFRCGDAGVVTGMGLGIMAAVGIVGHHSQWQMWW